MLRPIDRETSNFQVRLYFNGKNWYFIATETGTLLLKVVRLYFNGKNWYFIATETGTLLLKVVLEIGTLVLFS